MPRRGWRRCRADLNTYACFDSKSNRKAIFNAVPIGRMSPFYPLLRKFSLWYSGSPDLSRLFPFPEAKGCCAMELTVISQPLLALIAGILILIIPRLLNYVVAIYLILIGLLGLLR